MIYGYSPHSGDFGPVEARTTTSDPSAFELDVARRERAYEEGGLAAVGLYEGEHVETWRRLGGEFFLVCNGGDVGVGLSEERMILLSLCPDAMARDVMLAARTAIRRAELLADSPCPRVLLGGTKPRNTESNTPRPTESRCSMIR